MPSENSASNVATRWHGALQWAFIRQEEKHTHMHTHTTGGVFAISERPRCTQLH